MAGHAAAQADHQPVMEGFVLDVSIRERARAERTAVAARVDGNELVDREGCERTDVEVRRRREVHADLEVCELEAGCHEIDAGVRILDAELPPLPTHPVAEPEVCRSVGGEMVM